MSFIWRQMGVSGTYPEGRLFVLLDTHVSASRVIRRPGRGRPLYGCALRLLLAHLSQAVPAALGAWILRVVHHALWRRPHDLARADRSPHDDHPCDGFHRHAD